MTSPNTTNLLQESISLEKTKYTKKNKNSGVSNEEKQKLWKQFSENIPCKKKKSIEERMECIYTSNESREYCQVCIGKLVINEEGFLSCINKKCGVIYKDVLDTGAEWRYYGADDSQGNDPTRCGMPINPILKESSFGCKVMTNSNSSYEMKKIKQYTEWQSMPYKEKSKYDDFQIISSLASNSGIPKIIIDDAIRYYNKIINARTFRGINRDGILASSIYISCSINGYPRTAKEIASIFHLDTTSATKGCKVAISIINDLEMSMENKDKTHIQKTTPSSFLERYCSKLNINSELTKLCLFIAAQVEKKNLIPENTPHSISAGIVYFVCQTCNLNISKKQVNSISKISEVTINKCYKKLESYKNILIPKKIIEKYQKE